MSSAATFYHTLSVRTRDQPTSLQAPYYYTASASPRELHPPARTLVLGDPKEPPQPRPTFRVAAAFTMHTCIRVCVHVPSAVAASSTSGRNNTNASHGVCRYPRQHVSGRGPSSERHRHKAAYTCAAWRLRAAPQRAVLLPAEPLLYIINAQSRFRLTCIPVL